MDNNHPEIPAYLINLLESGQKIDEIRFTKEGKWYHNGEPFINEKIIALFNKSVDITADGQYVIHYGDHVYPITVEDTPYYITGVRIEGFASFERIFIRLNSGEEEELDIYSLYCGVNNALYCRIKNGRMPARFMRSPSFNILERLEEEADGQYSVRLCGQRIELKVKEEESEKIL